MRVKPYPILGLIVALLFGAGAATRGDQTGHRDPFPGRVGRHLTSKEGTGAARSLKTVVLQGVSYCSDATATAEFGKLHWWLSQQTDKDCARSLSPVWREICEINPTYSSDPHTDDDLLNKNLTEEDFITLCLGGEASRVISMMASVPNPRRTHLGLMTDRAIEAMQVAAAEADFLPLSHYLPWPSPASNSAATPEPETQSDSSDPGVLIFRNSKRPQHLVIFLIPELPTEGLDRQVFASAQRIIDKISPGVNTIPFDGPNFSGSVESLQALDKGLGAAKCIKAVSGSVTNAGENSQPKAGCASPLLAVIQTGDELALKAFVSAAGDFNYHCKQIAILSEEGTQYGEQNTSELCPKGDEHGGLWFLHFPREISKLRNAYGAEAGKPAQPDPSVQPDLGLQWQDVDAAQRDDLQTYGGQQTPLSQETVLSTLSITLKAQGIKALGILATDPLDEAFLIHSIKKSSPDVRLFLRDPDLLFLRTPDVASLNGTLLVSNYPLIPQNQFWSSTTRHERLITFPSAFQEGVYNAFIQLAEDPDWAPPTGKKANPENAPKMKRLEWNWPGADATANASGPGNSEHPLWLATIGTAGHYPINILNSTPAREAELKLHSLDLGPPQFFPMAFWGSLALLGVVHALGLKFRGMVHSYFKRDFDLSDKTNTVTMVRAFCHMMALLTITLAQLILGSSYLFFYRSGWQFTLLACLVGSATAFLLGAAGWQVRLLNTLHQQQSQLAVPDERSSIIGPKKILRTGVTGMAIMVGAGLFWIGVTLHTGFGNAFLHFRDLNLSSGVAPSLPIVSVLMVMYFGVWAYLRRLSYWEHRYVAMCNLKLDETIRQDLSGDVRAIDACLLGPLENKKWMTGFGVTLVASLLAFRPWITLDMIEPSGVWLFVLFLFFLALLTLWLNWFRFINIWVHLRNILEHLENLPIRAAFQRLPREKSLPILHWSSSQNTFLLRQVLDRLRALARAEASPENIALRTEFESCIDALMKCGVIETEVVEYRKVSGGAARPTLRTFSRSLAELRRAARDEMTKLTEILSARLLAEYWRRGSSGSKPDPEANPLDLKYLLAEDIVALPFYAYIRKVMTELRNMLFFLGVAISLLFAALHTYAFRADQSIDWWFFGLFAFMGGGIVFVIAQMERNALLSRLSDGTPGELGTGFYLELLKYGTVPFLTIFGSQVPSISNLLLKWVQPALEALH